MPIFFSSRTETSSATRDASGSMNRRWFSANAPTASTPFEVTIREGNGRAAEGEEESESAPMASSSRSVLACLLTVSSMFLNPFARERGRSAPATPSLRTISGETSATALRSHPSRPRARTPANPAVICASEWPRMRTRDGSSGSSASSIHASAAHPCTRFAGVRSEAGSGGSSAALASSAPSYAGAESRAAMSATIASRRARGAVQHVRGGLADGARARRDRARGAGRATRGDAERRARRRGEERGRERHREERGGLRTRAGGVWTARRDRADVADER